MQDKEDTSQKQVASKAVLTTFFLLVSFFIYSLT
jgi:hypothetical protein